MGIEDNITETCEWKKIVARLRKPNESHKPCLECSKKCEFYFAVDNSNSDKINYQNKNN